MYYVDAGQPRRVDLRDGEGGNQTTAESTAAAMDGLQQVAARKPEPDWGRGRLLGVTAALGAASLVESVLTMFYVVADEAQDEKVARYTRVGADPLWKGGVLT